MEDSKKEIMEATRKALGKHGYSDLSIQKIADEFSKSKSLLYHHYNSKDEILLEFMDQTLENFTENCIRKEKESSKQELMDKAFIGFKQEQEITKAMVEIRAQGVRDKRYRERFQKFSEAYREMIEKIIENNLQDKSGSIDAKKISKFVDLVNKEAMFSSAEGKQVEDMKKELERYLTKRLSI